MNGQQVQLLMNAILRAFTAQELAALVRTRLDQPLGHVVNPNAPLSQVAFDLISWAERAGRPAVERLVNALAEARPEHEYVRSAVCIILSSPPSPPGAAVSPVWTPDQSDPPVSHFPRGPAVPFNWVLRGRILDAFAGQFGSNMAIQEAVADAIRARLAADPGDPSVQTIRMTNMLNANFNPVRLVWHDTFQQACSQGPRMVAALLTRADRSLFVGDALAQRQALIGDLLVIQTLLGM